MINAEHRSCAFGKSVGVGRVARAIGVRCRCYVDYWGDLLWRQQRNNFEILLFESRVVSIDARHPGDGEEQAISGTGKQQKRSTPLKLFRVRGGFNQVIKHRVPPLSAGAIRVAGANWPD